MDILGGIVPNGLELSLENLMYVLDMKNKLIYVVVAEDRVYDVVFKRGKAYLECVVARKVKEIMFGLKISIG